MNLQIQIEIDTPAQLKKAQDIIAAILNTDTGKAKPTPVAATTSEASAPAKPKRPRGRPRKHPKPEEPKTPEADDSMDDFLSEPAKALTSDDVATAVREFIENFADGQKSGVAAAKTVILELSGATKISDIAEEHYAAIVERLKA